MTSEHYTAASRYHGGEQDSLSSHNLPKGLQNDPSVTSTRDTSRLNATISEYVRQYDDSAKKAVKAFGHIKGRHATSPYVSVAEDPIAFARLPTSQAQQIASLAPARSDYLIPNQFLVRPAQVEETLLGNPEIASTLAEVYQVPAISFRDPRSGQPKIYADDSSTVRVREALYLGNRHLDTFAVDRRANPYRKTDDER